MDEDHMVSRGPQDRSASGRGAAAHAIPMPVKGLCKEIGFAYDRRLERTDIFVAFAGMLISELEEQREMQVQVAKFGGAPPSEGSREVLDLCAEMLAAKDIADLIPRAADVHDACWRLNPDEAIPTDHLIDMASSCASAIRFGLDATYGSRHAAAAADHVWHRIYGISRFDSHTPEWGHAWARAKLIEALVSLLPAPGDGTASSPPQAANQVPGTTLNPSPGET